MSLLQDTGHAWSHFVACILLNRTRGAQVAPVLKEVLTRWSTPARLSACDPKELEGVIRSCGFQRIKAARLQLMSEAFPRWWTRSRREPERLPGVGEYGVESYRILFLKDLRYPKDKKLRKYVDDLDEKYFSGRPRRQRKDHPRDQIG